MKFNKTLLAAAMFALGGVAMTASAATTTTFDVKINITSVCSITDASATAIDFGDVPSTTTTDQTKSNNLSVTCSKGTPYSIGLTTATGTAGAGLMLPTDGQTDTGIPYTLYQPNAAGTTITNIAWGDSGTLLGTSNWHGTGDSTAKTISVFATVLGTNLDHAVGNYKDTVTVNVYL